MSGADPRMRIADSDRERAMADLAEHYAEGRLDHEEYDERLDAIWTARTRADLAVLFSDLPRPRAAQPPARRTPQPRGNRFRLPLLPVLAVLIVLSVLTGAPFWLLVFPLLFLRSRGGQGCGTWASGHPGHAGHAGHAGPTDYRRPRRTSGW